MPDHKFSDHDMEAVHRGLMVLLDVLAAQTALLTEIKAELTKPVPPSPVPEMLRLVLTKLDKIEGQVTLLSAPR